MGMNKKAQSSSKLPKTRSEAREARLKAALKVNMGRRKAQARARAAQTDDDHAQGSPAGEVGQRDQTVKGE